MAQGGGRGWFHRRKPQPEPEPVREPEATRLEAYEAQQTGDSRSEADRFRPPKPGSSSDFDSLLRPLTSIPGPAGDSTRAVPPPMSSRDERSDATAGDDRFAPPSPAARAHTPNEQAGATIASAAKSDPEPRTEPTSAASSAYDWDAATAAALSGDTGPDVPHGPPPPHHHGDPDKLLEDIIREIVGDAAAETVSSLHQPRPADPQESEAQRAAVRVVETSRVQASEVAEADLNAEPYSVFDEPVALESPVPRSVAAAATQPEHASSQPESAPAPALQPEPDRVPEAAREHSSSAYAPPPIQDPVAAPPADVSRETPHPNGGTPLADQLADETRRRLALEEAVLPLPPSTRILTISNQKGGVGKTTSAVNLAAALARAGAKVLVIDLDPQGNASTALGVEHRSDQQSVYDVLVGDLPLADVVRRSTEHDNLDCVPATIHLAGAEIELVSLVAREQRLRRALDAHLAEMEEPYDYVFIDCPPSLGLLTINAFVAAREVLIPIQCEYYALEGLSQLLSNIELIEKHLNPDLRLSTILLTMYDSRTNLAQQVAQEVRDHFPTQTLGTIIPRSVRVSEAPSYGQSVISYDYASSGSLSYREAAAEIAWRSASEQKESD